MVHGTDVLSINDSKLCISSFEEVTNLQASLLLSKIKNRKQIYFKPNTCTRSSVKYKKYKHLKSISKKIHKHFFFKLIYQPSFYLSSFRFYFSGLANITSFINFDDILFNHENYFHDTESIIVARILEGKTTK